MASLYRRGKTYYAQFYTSGNRRQLSLKTKDRKSARRLVSELETATDRGVWNPTVDSLEDFLNPIVAPTRLSEWIDAFMESRALLRPRTIETYAQILRLYKDEGADLNKFLLKRRDVTRQKYYRHLRVFYNWIVRQRWLDKNPCDDLQLPRPVQKEAHYFSRREIALLFSFIRTNASNRDGMYLPQMIEFVCQTGLRLGEVHALRWEWIDNTYLRLPRTESFVAKSGREDRIYLSREARSILAQLPRDHEIVFNAPSPIQVSKRFLFWRRRAGLSSGSFHTLRHTCATWMAMNGADIYIIKSHMRHSTLSITERYMHVSPSETNSRIERALDRHSG